VSASLVCLFKRIGSKDYTAAASASPPGFGKLQECVPGAVKLVKLSYIQLRNSFDCLILRLMKNSNTHETRSVLLAAVFLLTFGLCSNTGLAQNPVKDATPAGFSQTAPGLTQQKQTSPATDPTAILRSAKNIYVSSSSVLVGEAVIEAKLRKRSEFQQLGLAITRDPSTADLVLELKHDLFTMYVYTAIDPRTSIVVASGKLSSLGGTVSGKVAKRFLKQIARARLQSGP
jgi:hypothetical protein